MKKHLVILLVVFAGAGLISVRGQDPFFSQIGSNLTYYNPAYSGIVRGLRARFSFRDQWPALPYDFKTYYFDADLGSRSLPGAGGVGIFLRTDNEGIGFIRNTHAGVSFAVRIRFSDLSSGQLGIRAGWYQKRVNWDDFVFSDALSERYGNTLLSGFIEPDINTRNMADFGIGGVYQFGNDQRTLGGTLGLAVDHLFEPDQSFLSTAKAPLPRKWVAHADLIISMARYGSYYSEFNDDLKINPGFLFQSQGGLNAMTAGINLTKYNVNLGIWYKGAFGDYNNSSLAFMAGYRYFFQQDLALKFTYSYDMQMSGALMGTGGAHEISLILDFSSDNIFPSPRTGTRTINIGGKPSGSPWECPAYW